MQPRILTPLLPGLALITVLGALVAQQLIHTPSSRYRLTQEAYLAHGMQGYPPEFLQAIEAIPTDSLQSSTTAGISTRMKSPPAEGSEHIGFRCVRNK